MYRSRGVALRIMMEVCIRLLILSLTVAKISLNSEVSIPWPDDTLEATATLLGLAPDAIEQAAHTIRYIGRSVSGSHPYHLRELLPNPPETQQLDCKF